MSISLLKKSDPSFFSIMTRACELEFQGRLVYPSKTPFLIKEQMIVKQVRKSWKCRTIKTLIIGTILPERTEPQGFGDLGFTSNNVLGQASKAAVQV
jgi:hypothetical protein